MNSKPSGKIQTTSSYPGKKILRKMGYLSDQKGIINRYLREQEGWTTHVENTRQFIIEAVKDAKPESIIVFGSGWLIDFPLEEVYSLCPIIELHDIQHPPQVMRKIRDLNGVTAVLSDITGGMIQSVWDFVSDRKREKGINNLQGIEYQKPVRKENLFCVSLNILNQLDILLIDFLKKYFNLNEQVCNDFRKFVQSSHLEMIGKNSCLITDVEEIRKSFNTHEEIRKNLIYIDLPEGKKTGEWLWDFDSAGLYHEKSSTKMRVKAISF
ncbi:MAG: hypothetical protein ACP5E3_05480 [Bacteroidales bacterium]